MITDLDGIVKKILVPNQKFCSAGVALQRKFIVGARLDEWEIISIENFYGIAEIRIIPII